MIPLLKATVEEKQTCPFAIRQPDALLYKCRITKELCIVATDCKRCIIFEKAWKEDIRKEGKSDILGSLL